MARILGRVTELLLDGTRVSPLPPAIRQLILENDCTLSDYLELDDPTLWQCLKGWQASSDVVLADLCRRLQNRDLFKTFELFGNDGDPDPASSALEVARDLARQAGFDPDVYVGLDRAVLLPYDDSKQKLRVLFPHGDSQPLHEVSFLLGRLRGQRLEKVRLLVPTEVREALRKVLSDRKGAA